MGFILEIAKTRVELFEIMVTIPYPVGVVVKTTFKKTLFFVTALLDQLNWIYINDTNNFNGYENYPSTD